MNKRMDNPEGQVTYPAKAGRPGYLLALVLLQLRFYLCSFIIAWKCRMRLKILICEFDMPASSKRSLYQGR